MLLKQLRGGILRKSFPENFRKIRRKTSELEGLFSKYKGKTRVILLQLFLNRPH